MSPCSFQAFSWEASSRSLNFRNWPTGRYSLTPCYHPAPQRLLMWFGFNLFSIKQNNHIPPLTCKQNIQTFCTSLLRVDIAPHSL